MKALVLSGGTGSSLRPITHTSATQLVPVATKPVLFYGLESLAEAGITEGGMIVGETAAEIGQAVGDGSKFGLDVTCSPQERPLGLAHAVLIARDFLGDDFARYLGDDFAVGGIRFPVEEFRTHRPDAQMLLTRVPDPRAFGVAELDGAGRVVVLHRAAGLLHRRCKPDRELADRPAHRGHPDGRGHQRPPARPRGPQQGAARFRNRSVPHTGLPQIRKETSE
ncbi:Nucleotidyl transferase [Streptomyces sp. 2231.1]|nr:Nucleotidyl transferase [Streptomyces sp. 2231.1]